MELPALCQVSEVFNYSIPVQHSTSLTREFRRKHLKPKRIVLCYSSQVETLNTSNSQHANVAFNFHFVWAEKILQFLIAKAYMTQKPSRLKMNLLNSV